MSTYTGDVVISGIGGYFPKALNVNAFKERLYSNESLLEPKWPEGERGVINLCGCIPYQTFDNSFFGIHRQQTTFMDPMHRLILERTFESLVDAGVNPTEIRGKNVGVYMGSTVGENDNLFLESVVSGFGVTGHSRAMMPNRVSYWLNLHGPSVAYDANWMNGMEVLRLAVNSIRTGQCESVIVGTANLAIHSEFQWKYNDMGLLSPDAKTRAFDANANGYGRSDGVVVMYIQKATDARRSYGSIVHIAARFDGRNNDEILSHNTEHMVEFLEDFYKKSPVKPESVDFVETYGCALKDIDKKELDSLEKVYCQNRSRPLLIGSVKTVCGHAEASSVMFSIVKVLLAMECQQLPATLNFETPNPDIQALHNGSMEVLTTNTKWTGQYAAVNALGINSYYGHILLKACSKTKVPIKMDLPMLVNISTRTEEGIKEILEEIKKKPKDPEFYSLLHNAFSNNIQGHLYRGYAFFGEEVKQESEHHMGNKRQIWFVYSGMGSQWNGMISDLMRFEVCAKSLRKSHDILAARGLDLMKIISTDDKTIFDTILNCFVGIAAIQIALTDLLRALDIVPDGIIGHSVGELGCAYADGCMTHEQMILAAYCRGRASVEAELITGMMAAVGLGYNQIKNRMPEAIEVACHNGPESCTISGPTEDMEKFVKELKDQGVFARLVNVANIAYHSRYIKPAAPLLLKYLKDVMPEPVARSSKWISTSNMQSQWDTHLAKHSSAEYHTNNLLSSVLFEEGCKHIPKDSILIEIAPHGLLQAILKRSVENVTNVPLTQRGAKSGVEFLLQSLGKLYLAGLDFNMKKIYPKVETPVSRGTAPAGDLVKWNHTDLWVYHDAEDKLHNMEVTKEYEISLTSDEFREMVGHQLKDKVVLPTSFYLEVLISIFEASNPDLANVDLVFENVHVRKHLIIPKTGFVPLHAMVQKGSGEFEVISDKDVLVTGKITFPSSDEPFMFDPAPVKIAQHSVDLTSGDFYSEMQHRGYKYSGQYKSLKGIILSEKGSVSQIQCHSKWSLLLESIFQQNLLMAGERAQEVHVPKFIQKICIAQSQLPTEGETVQVDFEYATKMLSAQGLQLIGMTTVPLYVEEVEPYLECVETVLLNEYSFETHEGGLEFALRLLLNNFHVPDVNTIFVSELKTEHSLFENVRNILNECSEIDCHLTSVNELKDIVPQNSYPQLVIVNNLATKEVFQLISSSSAALLCKTDKNALNQPDIVQVAQFKMRSMNYSILKKVDKSKVSIVQVKGDTLSIKDLRRASASWVTDLAAAVKDAKLRGNSVSLISSQVPLEGFVNFVQEMRSQPDMQGLRFVFNLDRKTQDYTPIFNQGLRLVVIQNGALSTCLPLSFKYKDNIKLEIASSSTIQNKTIKYLGVNLRDETINQEIAKKNEIGNIDYSAVTTSGNNVVGLAHLDKDSTKLVLDPILQWEVPELWSLEDAATVPHAFVSAYYMMVIKAKVKPGQTVLIHAGCSPIGIAAASIASSYGCQIYVTVSAEWQRAYLKKLYTFLRDPNILNSDDDSFEDDLKNATNGIGAHVILNCVSGRLLRHSLACIADYGSFIHYGKYDVEEGNSIGMFCFLRNTSFYVVNLENIVLQSKQVKEEIKKLMSDGIEKLYVRPLAREVTENYDIPGILSQLKRSTNIGKVLIKVNDTLKLSKLNIDKPNKFICNSKNSYLVYGGSAENWADITEWLVLRGARKIVIASDSKDQQNYINRRLSLLQTYYEAHIITASSKAATKEGAGELISEVNNLGPIQAVFILPSKTNVHKSSDIKSIQYLENSLKIVSPKATFVNFVSLAAGVCYARNEAGFSTYNIQSAKGGDITDSIFTLDDTFSSKASYVIARKTITGEMMRDKSRRTFKDLKKLLPTIDEIIKEQRSAPEEPDLVQVITEGPVEIRELAPLFVIPGLTGSAELENLFLTLLYPTFCAVIPKKSWPTEKLAHAFAQKMRAIFPKGIYNIVSTSSGGVLAIAIAKILDKQGFIVHMFLIDNAPIIIQQGFKQLGDSKDDMQVNILRAILDIKDSELLARIKSAPNWESRVKQVSGLYKENDRKQKLFHNGLLRLNDRIERILSYKPSEKLATTRVHLIRPDDTSKFDICGLEEYCQKPPQVLHVSGDHLSIIDTVDTSEYINKNHFQ